VATFGNATLRTQSEAVRRDNVALVAEAAAAPRRKFRNEYIGTGTIVLPISMLEFIHWWVFPLVGSHLHSIALFSSPTYLCE
jgi:hypothetical protein